MIDLDNWELVTEAPEDIHKPPHHDWPQATHAVYGRVKVNPDPHETTLTYYTLSRFGPDNATHGPFKALPVAFDLTSDHETARLQYNVLQGTAPAAATAAATAEATNPTPTSGPVQYLAPTAAELRGPTITEQNQKLARSVALAARGLLTKDSD